MSSQSKWVPMKWPCGPLQASLVNQTKGDTAAMRKTAEGWTEPAMLELLKGTPVNCLVVDWAAGGALDQSQQDALKPLIAAGRKLGLSFVGKITAPKDFASTVRAARSAGLDAVMLDSPSSQPLELPVILRFPRDSISWEHVTEVFCASGNGWPGVTLPTMRGDTAVAGPTGDPWVDSNGWFALLSRQMASGKSLWIDLDPPDFPAVVAVENYCLAIADCGVYGSRWILSLGEEMRAGLLDRSPAALSDWKRICETLAFFEGHGDWEAYKPLGILAVASDFSGSNASMSGEVLNLLSRRQVQFTIVDRRTLEGPVKGLKAILWVDDQVPNAAQLRELIAFVELGGVLIAPAYWGPAGIAPRQENWLFGYDIYDLRKGRIVVATGGFSDPYQLARDTHLLVGRENDLARLYNPGTTNCYTSIDAARHKQLIQIVNYAKKPATYVALWVNEKSRGAKLWSPEVVAANPMSGDPASEGTSFNLPALAVNCAIEIERPVQS